MPLEFFPPPHCAISRADPLGATRHRISHTARTWRLHPDAVPARQKLREARPAPKRRRRSAQARTRRAHDGKARQRYVRNRCFPDSGGSRTAPDRVRHSCGQQPVSHRWMRYPKSRSNLRAERIIHLRHDAVDRIPDLRRPVPCRYSNGQFHVAHSSSLRHLVHNPGAPSRDAMALYKLFMEKNLICSLCINRSIA